MILNKALLLVENKNNANQSSNATRWWLYKDSTRTLYQCPEVGEIDRCEISLRTRDLQEA